MVLSSLPRFAARAWARRGVWPMVLVFAATGGLFGPHGHAQDLIVNSGTTTISADASYTNTYVAQNSGNVATLALTGGTLTNSFLLVGQSGTGTFNMTGGRVNANGGLLGYSAGGVGTATVSSGTWANSGPLYVGYNGSGSLTV